MNRGGSWNNSAANCRTANRNRNQPTNRNNNLGFRVALAPQAEWMLCQTEPIVLPSCVVELIHRQNTPRCPVLVALANAPGSIFSFVYEDIRLMSWCGHARQADTWLLRRRLFAAMSFQRARTEKPRVAWRVVQ